MLSEEVIDRVIEKLVRRVESANSYVLRQIGNNLDEMSTLNSADAQKLVQILKYGGSYDKIVKQIAKATDLNVKDIYKIFDEVAKNDYQFAEQFYKYRNIDYIPYEENIALQNKVRALARITAKDYVNFTQTSALGFGFVDDKSLRIDFRGIREEYFRLLDEALLNVGQGKESFNEAMYKRLRQIGSSGLKVIYPTTYVNKEGKLVHHTRRLDSALRMNLKDGLKNLHNETQRIFGEQFQSDGVEITVHENPAPDHELVQGRQFSNKEFNNFQNDRRAVSYDGTVFEPEFEGHDRRSISQYNCYHTTFRIILGVSKPEYNDEQLQQIIDNNNKQFEFEGKKYTRYEGTQLQRRIETEIRKQKDLQILGRSSGNEKLIQESQSKITKLTNKYNKLSKVSGLPTKVERMRVEGYHRLKRYDEKKPKDKYIISINEQSQARRINYRKEYLNEQIKISQKKLDSIPKDSQRSWDVTYRKLHEKDIKNYQKELNQLSTKDIEAKTIELNSKESCIDLLNEVNIKLSDKNLDKLDIEVLRDTSLQYYNLCEKYPFLEQSLQENDLKMIFDDLPGGTIGMAEVSGRKIELSISDFKNKDDLLYWGKYQTKDGYNMPCSSEHYMHYFSTHEMGHSFDYRIINNVELSQFEDLGAREFYTKTNEYFLDNIYKIAEKNTGKSKEELVDLLSDYGKSSVDEAMAELFANANCGKPNALGRAYDEYFKELLK